MRERIFEFRLSARERRRVIEVFDALGAIGLDDDQFETAAGGGVAGLASNKIALTFVKPDHRASVFPWGTTSLT